MRNFRLIFLDRNELTRALFSYVLEGSSGIDVVAHAADRKSAIELIRKHEPDAIVTGYDLPLQEKSKLRSGLREEFPEMLVMDLSELDKAVSKRLVGRTSMFRFHCSEMIH